MPILDAETSIYPNNLFSAADVDPSDRRWIASYTKSRQEKALARHLVGMRIPFYLPLVRKNNLIRGRRVQSLIPLFGGYVFLFGNETERVKSLMTNRISKMIEVDDQRLLSHDLRQIERLIHSDAPLTVESQLGPGRRVRIKNGSMMGLEGTVVSRRGETRLLVAVSFLHQGVSVEIDDFVLEPID
mgnify:CR=1 FL=1